MKKLTMIAFTGILIVGLLAGCASSKPKGDNDDTGKSTTEASENANYFSQLDTTDIAGNSVTSGIFADKKLTLINVWATFCGPCINELPVLEALSQEYKDQGVGVVGLLIDTTTSKPTAGLSDSEEKLATQLLSDANASYPQIVMSESMLLTELANINTFPTSFFVDSEGNFVGTSILGANTENGWRKQIDTHLKGLENRK